MADEELNDLRNRMVNAAIADGELVREGKPAYQKLKLLPEVVSILNRNTITSSILDLGMGDNAGHGKHCKCPRRAIMSLAHRAKPYVDLNMRR